MCVPVGPALWGVEVVSEWRAEEMGKAVVKWLQRKKKTEWEKGIELSATPNKNKHTQKMTSWIEFS